MCYTSLLSKYNEKGNNAFKLQLKETTKSILKMEKKAGSLNRQMSRFPSLNKNKF